MNPMSMTPQVRFIVLLGVLLLFAVNSQLQVGIYSNTCGFAEFIVKEKVRKFFIKYRGFEVIDRAKQILEIHCKGIVSCADILAFAARDSIEIYDIIGGQCYDLPAGRRDGRVSLASEVDGNYLLPHSTSTRSLNYLQKKDSLKMKWSHSGVHTIDRTHCSSFSSRLYSFNSTTAQDPTLDSNYAAMLKQQCPQDNPNAVVPMDPSSPATSDANYYVNVLANRGLFTSDQSLLTNTATATASPSKCKVSYTMEEEFCGCNAEDGPNGRTYWQFRRDSSKLPSFQQLARRC